MNKNEILNQLPDIPVIHTDRLLLDKILPEDISVYNAIVLDQTLNKWWGYDDLGELTEPFTANSFFHVAETDWHEKTAINWAIRIGNKMIGEAVLYDFNARNAAELGVRIDKDHHGHGYGTEAFQAVCKWALSTLKLSAVIAKCFHENTASYKMLSSCMKETGSDDTFYYFSVSL